MNDEIPEKVPFDDAVQEAFAAWSEVKDRNSGRIPADMLESAVSLEEALAKRFGISPKEAAQASDLAYRSLTVPEMIDEAQRRLKEMGVSDDR